MKPHCIPWRGAFLALGAGFLLAGCGGKTAPDHGSLTLILTQPGGGNPLDPSAYPTLTTLYVEIDDSLGTMLASQSFDVTKPIELDHAPVGPQRVFVVQTEDGSGTSILSGQSAPVDLVEGDHAIVTVMLQ